MANQNSILLFTSDTDTVSTLVSHITPKLTSLSRKHTRLVDDGEYYIKKGYYFYKYYKPLDPKGYYPLMYSLKLHLKREHDIN
jgi:hypothetical protein